MTKKLKWLALLALLIVTALLLTNYWISYQAKDKLYSTVDTIPKNKVGLLLGTSKFLSNGNINLYYTYRINAAVALFNANKIDFILISGDNGSKSYDEPTTFKEDLIARGIPEDRIVLDYAGFRTLDSVVRAKAIFGQESITIISQQFHNERALYLASHNAINAVAFNAKDVSGRYGLKVQLREYLARAKASSDILFNVEPKFFGDPIEIK
ncbi:vancomycin high temperature exclusion protein [Psychroserpens sp. SPM9]|uniref:SanA/YdcF family protein n=1 Tax=Psychroserpens sp. SPM9 TaxID=2975598 RepID=UPI0021A310BD|nr:ElyC/SanA/YdcF family protein [Psychroserpens sp. SPM9]MDG5492670.1 ElyC/SanA/YdcF family protein [Psychroserpens sp. SPM9]